MTRLSTLFRHIIPFSCICAISGSIWGCSDKAATEPPMPPLPRNIDQAMAAPKGPSPSPLLAIPESPRPTVTPPDVAYSKIVGKTLLPGDQAIAERLAIEMQGAQKPTYKSNVDYPFNDGAAHAISEEVRQWVREKMAALGFSEAEGKPSLSWVIHIQPDADERYLLETSLHSEGSLKFKKNFVVPAQYSSTRMNEVFAADFVPELP